MLTHLSTKFRMESAEDQSLHEPRVALILNRFTRTLTIMYASHASTQVFGITPEEFTGKSFFECIDQNCLQDAVDALERAKENDSIAYLRFQWRDPRPDQVEQQAPPPEPETPLRRSTRISSRAKRKAEEEGQGNGEGSSSQARPTKRRGAIPRGGASSQAGESSTAAAAGNAPSSSVVGGSASATNQVNDAVSNVRRVAPTEVEAVVSCTSDGLVVILRAARPLIPKPLHEMPGGVFASPWAPVPLVPPAEAVSDKAREDNFMEAIREVAVFAWSLRQLGGEVVLPNAEKSPGSESKLQISDGSSSEDVSAVKGAKDEVDESADGPSDPAEVLPPSKKKSKSDAAGSAAKRDEEPKTPKGRRKAGRK
ncbi:hypothetical protein ABW19_dt0210456 [Dactylella cylindrospora]|nr:hypothetical protein ABW19_dt0210456 [Dactylella cylindrospora]